MKLTVFLSCLTIFLAFNVGNTNCESLETQARIVGKTWNAGYVQFVWQVLIPLDDGGVCNGALISLDWVLTAASCVDGKSTVNLKLGYPERNDTAQVSKTSSEITVHPDYDAETLENDIALLKLSEPAEQGQYIKPGPYIPDDVDLNKKSLTLSSYGSTSRDSDEYPDNLKQAYFDVITNDACKDMYTDGSIFETQLCAKAMQKTDSVGCKGDEGAPATTLYNKKYPIAAIFSFSGPDCSEPSVFTRVSKFIDWIQETTGVEPGKEW